jgi:DNA-binding LacI/PurR family transcriptional regulator
MVERQPRTRNRPSTKTDDLQMLLRRQIVEGRYPPGTRLPTRDELQKQHNVSAITVQRALDVLTKERLVVARTRSGTFVVPDPPHLTQFVIVLNQNASGANWSQFDLALVNESGDVARQRGRKIDVCYGVEPHEDNEVYNMLRRRVQKMNLAGMIFSDNPSMFLGTPLMEAPHVPRVTLAPGVLKEGVPSVSVDYEDFYDKALNYLISRGRRRIAFLGRPMFTFMEYLMDGLRQRGMETRAHWMQSPSLERGQAISNCANLLMRCGGEMPDGLIIDDDHFVESATAGMLAAGVQPGDAIDVVAHCNFPWPTKSSIVVKRLGFDVRQVLHRCMELLEAQRRGETVPMMNKIGAVFEDSLHQK